MSQSYDTWKLASDPEPRGERCGAWIRKGQRCHGYVETEGGWCKGHAEEFRRMGRAGGFDETSYTTRFTPGTSFTMRAETFARRS